MKFSVIIPIKDEVELLPWTLPSWFRLQPDEVIACIDSPPDKTLVRAIRRINEDVVILAVDRDPSWFSQLAHVRREGFKEASNDIIATGDIDLVVTTNVLRAINRIERGVGLACLQKRLYPSSLLRMYRSVGNTIIRPFLRSLRTHLKREQKSLISFTGLYAFSKEKWMKAEPEDAIKNWVDIHQDDWTGLSSEEIKKRMDNIGEDKILHNCMKRAKYSVLYLPYIGGYNVSTALYDKPLIQWNTGLYYAVKGANLRSAIIQTIITARPHFLRGYLYQKRCMSAS